MVDLSSLDSQYRMTEAEKRLIGFLVEHGFIGDQGLSSAVEYANAGRISLQAALVKLQLIHPADIVRALTASSRPAGESPRKVFGELVHIHEGRVLSRMTIEKPELSIGRVEENDIVIDHRKVSRHHARIVSSADGVTMVDCGSTTGCFHKGKKFKKRLLANRDAIQIADHIVLYLAKPGDHVREREQPRGQLPDGAQGPAADPELGMLQTAFYDQRAGQDGVRRLQALFEISKILESTTDFQNVLAQIMDHAISIMGAERGFLLLADPSTGTLKVHVARDRKGDLGDAERERLSHSLVERVATTRAPELILDAQTENKTESIAACSIHSALCVPLISRDAVSGVIYVDHSSRSHAFTRSDLAFFTTFAVQAKTAIDSSRAYWELVDSLFRASDDFIVVCSPGGQVTQANCAAATLLGRPAAQLLGCGLDELFSPEDGEMAQALVSQTLASGVVSGCELSLLGDGGRRISMSVSSFVLRDRLGDAIGMCLIGRDLSELRSLIAELTAAKERVTAHNTFIRKTFGRYLSDDVVASLLETPDGLNLGGQRRKVTILMSDLRGFTAVSERLPPEDVVRILNNFLGRMVEIIDRRGGTVNEFIGDAILVVFGAPVAHPDDGLRAVACALEMQLAMRGVNEWNRAHGFGDIEMGIGVNTAEVVVGNIGSEKRSKYAVVGQHVNLTSRIESYTVGGQILISEGTRTDVGEALVLGSRLEIQAKGVRGTVTVHELVGVGAPLDLRLPSQQTALVELTLPLAIRFTLLEGKHVTEELHDGSITHLSENTAVIRSTQQTPAFGNVKILVERDQRPGETDEIYAKVLDVPVEHDSGFVVRFTYVPGTVRAFLDSSRLRKPAARGEA
ncbi:MAG: GAF domain-containing protein [Candidatus Riflebacteria bacterium]|nr:GAF domain-containing protein [Candidatus Riflebacteria bacterium]